MEKHSAFVAVNHNNNTIKGQLDFVSSLFKKLIMIKYDCICFIIFYNCL